MKYYSAMTKNDILPFANNWMDLEVIIAKGEKSEKDNYSMISLVCRT